MALTLAWINNHIASFAKLVTDLANALIAAARPAHPRKNFKFGYACPSTLLESLLDGALIH